MDATAELFDAIRDGDVSAARRLLDTDPALVTARDSQGISPLMAAAYTFNGEMKALILARTPILGAFEAAIVGDSDRLETLLGAEAAVVSTYSPDGFTFLHFAGFFNHPDVARLLLAHGASVSAITRNAMSNMPLHAAAAGRSLDVCRQLLEAGADVNAQQHGGVTPLHEAAHHGNSELVDLLLARGADKSLLTDDGKTAAALAAEHDHADLVVRLSTDAGVRG